MKYILAAVVVLMCLIIALFMYSADRDQKNFSAAKNRCEVGCIQDSGGLQQCREFCAKHPEHYP